MRKRIFRSTLLVTLGVLLASLVLIVGVLYSSFRERMMADLVHATAYVAHAVENEGLAYLTENLPDESRVTWVAADGSVLFDNWENAATMTNHADRQEIRSAMETGVGAVSRRSDTMAKRTVYYAVRLENGTVLRLASTYDSLWSLMLHSLWPAALILIATFVVALWLAGRLSRQLVAPVNAIDLTNPDDEGIYEELAPLVGRIRSQNRQIRQQVEDLRKQREEFAAITSHMNEGLLVIDRDTRVLSHNGAALQLLEYEDAFEEGISALVLNREAAFRRCVETVLEGARCEELLEREDSCCRIYANPVEEGGRITGAVLILMDVTEKERLETLRREFATNVSHELKTPLTSILGTAEIIQNGLVKPEDIHHFSGNIYREASRLIRIVNDIIKVSRLDEGGPTGQWERVSLRWMAERVVDYLTRTAESRGVTMTLEGNCAEIMGVPQIVEEVIYNLCDNAIKYNYRDGRVSLRLASTPEGEVLTVSDTGIGIPPEIQERVFERFYRADKSHSRGGTGLGLSIVKHGAAYLGARVTLESQEGKGSVFTLTFPRAEDDA